MERYGITIVKTMSLYKEQIDWLKLEAKKRKITVSEFIRELIDEKRK